MKSELIEFIGSARKRRSDKFRHQLTIFLICLTISIFLWTLVRLSKEYYYSIEYHLVFSNAPANLKLTDCSDSIINLKIRIQGFEFFSQQFILKQYREYEVNLHNVKFISTGDQPTGYLLTNRIGKEIISQSDFANEVYFVSPDTLFFAFDRQTIKKMTPKGQIDLLKNGNPSRDSSFRRADSMIRHGNPSRIGTIKK